MRTINVGNDYAFRKQLEAKAKKAKEQEVKQYDNNPTAGTQEPESIEQEQQADTQEPAKEEAQKEKKGKGKKA